MKKHHQRGIKGAIVLALVSFLAIVPLSGQAADIGSISQTNEVQGPLTKTTLYWTTWTNLSAADVTLTRPLRGEIERVSIIGDTATNDFTVEIFDANNVSIFSRSAIPSNEAVTLKPALQFTDGPTTNLGPVIINDLLRIVVTNAGDAVTGRLILYVR